MQDSRKVSKEEALARLLARRRVGALTVPSIIRARKRALQRRLRAQKAFMGREILGESYNLVCLVCGQICVCSACLPCGHTFCYTCIEAKLQFSPECPHCHSYVSRRRLSKVTNMNRLIGHFYEQVEGLEDLEKRKERVELAHKDISAKR